MRQSRPLLPLRVLDIPARTGRPRRKLASTLFATSDFASASPVRVRREQLDFAVARAVRAAWLNGPLFQQPSRLPSSFADARHAA